MNRTCIFGIAVFLAVLGCALMSAEQATAGGPAGKAATCGPKLLDKITGLKPDLGGKLAALKPELGAKTCGPKLLDKVKGLKPDLGGKLAALKPNLGGAKTCGPKLLDKIKALKPELGGAKTCGPAQKGCQQKAACGKAADSPGDDEAPLPPPPRHLNPPD